MPLAQKHVALAGLGRGKTRALALGKTMQARGHKIMAISALARTDTDKLLLKAVGTLAEAPALEEIEPPMPVYRPEEDPRDFTISREDDGGWRLHFERSRDQGKTWEKTGPVNPGVNGEHFDSIQASILDHGEGVLQVICRTRQGYASTSWSYDNGETWSPTTASILPNTGSGSDAVTLKDGRHLVIYNNTSGPPERLNKGVRFPLDLAVSKDGVHWDHLMTLETEPRGAGYAYPAIIQGKDGRIHITYTWDRKLIKHVVIDPNKI